MEKHMSIERRQIGPRMSQLVIHNGVAYLAGQVADDPAAPLAEQARQLLAAVDRLLAEAGTDKSRLLSVTVYLANMGLRRFQRRLRPMARPGQSAGPGLRRSPPCCSRLSLRSHGDRRAALKSGV